MDTCLSLDYGFQYTCAEMFDDKYDEVVPYDDIFEDSDCDVDYEVPK